MGDVIELNARRQWRLLIGTGTAADEAWQARQPRDPLLRQLDVLTKLHGCIPVALARNERGLLELLCGAAGTIFELSDEEIEDLFFLIRPCASIPYVPLVLLRDTDPHMLWVRFAQGASLAEVRAELERGDLLRDQKDE